jgi:hypothetical protein
MVEDYEERLQQNEERVRKGLDGLHIEDEAVAKEEQAQELAESEKEGGSKVVNDTPCIRVLEGHSKAVTALYYEDGCLVSQLETRLRFRSSPLRSPDHPTRRFGNGTSTLVNAS